MARETDLFDSVTAAHPEFYTGLRDSFVSKPNGKTHLVTAGLTGSGKTTLIGQLFYKLSQDPEVQKFCADTKTPFTAYYHSFGQGISYAKTKYPELIITPTEPFQPSEYGVVSTTMRSLVTKGHESLPNPAIMVFDSVNITGVVNENNEVRGVDRGTSVAQMIAQEYGGFTAAVASPLELRQRALTGRDRIRGGEDPTQVVTEMGIEEDETDPVRLKDLYSKTGTWASLAGNDRHLNELMFNLIALGEVPQPQFDLEKPEDFMADQFIRMTYLKGHFYPFWNNRLYQGVTHRGFSFQNADITPNVRSHSKLIADANLINALQSRGLI